jgi:hypothetical protein
VQEKRGQRDRHHRHREKPEGAAESGRGPGQRLAVAAGEDPEGGQRRGRGQAVAAGVGRVVDQGRAGRHQRGRPGGAAFLEEPHADQPGQRQERAAGQEGGQPQRLRRVAEETPGEVGEEGMENVVVRHVIVRQAVDQRPRDERKEGLGFVVPHRRAEEGQPHRDADDADEQRRSFAGQPPQIAGKLPAEPAGGGGEKVPGAFGGGGIPAERPEQDQQRGDRRSGHQAHGKQGGSGELQLVRFQRGQGDQLATPQLGRQQGDRGDAGQRRHQQAQAENGGREAGLHDGSATAGPRGCVPRSARRCSGRSSSWSTAARYR